MPNDKLDALWAEYREACPDRDASADFMPKLWHRIDARRNETLSLIRRFAQVCVAATVALALLLVIIPEFQTDTDSGTYADVLAAEQTSNYAQILAGEL
jgi:negative regulator of sigma E activity